MASSAPPSVSSSCPSSSRPAHCHGGPGRGAIKRTSGGTGAAPWAVFPLARHRFLTAQRSGGSFAAKRWRVRVGRGRRQRETPPDGESDCGGRAAAAGGNRAVLCKGGRPAKVVRTGSFSPAIPARFELGAPLCPEICRNILPVVIWPGCSKRPNCAAFCMLWV
jgi:hypothetical protein